MSVFVEQLKRGVFIDVCALAIHGLTPNMENGFAFQSSFGVFQTISDYKCMSIMLSLQESPYIFVGWQLHVR